MGKEIINMNLEIGDSIELEIGGKYAILMDAVIDNKKYYLISNEKNVSELLIVQIDRQDVKIIKDRKEIEKVINFMTDNKD